ncbi:MAG: hypothetical protein ACRDRV_20395 [Pseudonocardiaceae bacterium]
MKLKIVDDLLAEAVKSPVFGDSFGRVSSGRPGLVLGRVEEILDSTVTELGRCIELGMPELESEEVAALVRQIAPKAVCFCPALAADELTDTRRLSASAVAIGLMYWADQTMDRGDIAMPVAIELFGGRDVSVPDGRAELVQARLAALTCIEREIGELAKPEDAPLVLACFREQVLLNETRLHKLSIGYQNSDDRAGFLAVHATEIAQCMVTDAGFPSVSSSLYSIYRWHCPELPALAAVHAEEALVDLLQVCNSVVRVADELGDWEIDTGHHPTWGSFAINLFNQQHPSLLSAFLEEARLRPDARVGSLLRAFAGFRDGTDREKYGEHVMDHFFEHGRDRVNHLSRELRDKYHMYIKICKRILEIGYVNKVGDIALAGI